MPSEFWMIEYTLVIQLYFSTALADFELSAVVAAGMQARSSSSADRNFDLARACPRVLLSVHACVYGEASGTFVVSPVLHRLASPLRAETGLA